MSFPSDTQRGIPAWLAKFGPTLFRARYRASVGDSNAATKVPVIIQGAPSQTANLFECYDSAKNLLAAIDASGVVTSAGGVTNPSANSLAISTLVRGTNGQLLIGQTGAATAYETVTGDVGITAGGVTALASSVLKVVSVSLTNANIKNLRATPFQLVAAPAANFMLEFISAKLLLVAGINVLTEAGYNLAVKFTDGSGAQVSQTIECTGFIDQATNTITNGLPKIDAIVPAASASAAALVLHNLGGAEFGGNAGVDATMKIDIVYRVHATN